MVELSRTNPAIVRCEEGAGNGAARCGLVVGSKTPFRNVYGFHAKSLWARMMSYEVAGKANEFVRHPAQRGCYFRRGLLAICINPRWSERSGERLNFYIQQTVPGGGQS